MSGEPWLARKEWAARRLLDENSSGAYGFLIFTVIWILFSCGLAFVFFRADGDDGSGRWLVLIFPGVGVLLLIAVTYVLLRRRRYGVPVLELATLPAPVGRVLGGLVRTRAVFDPAGGFVVTLRCIQKTVTGSGKNRSTRETTLWEGKRTIAGAVHETGGIAIPVAMAVPADARESDRSDSSNEILWKLGVSAAVEGIDFNCQFEVPVFRTAESATPLTPEEAARLDS